MCIRDSYYSVSAEPRFLFLYPLLKTEISSIFYVLKYWLPPKTIIYNVNSLLFLLTFYKFRIWDFYCDIIHNNKALGLVFEMYSSSNIFTSYILLFSCYGLYVLNLYWFLIMNKILFKQVVKLIPKINSDKLCHLLCSLIHWINIPLSIYLYSFKPNEKNIFDVIGITSLTISSYNYHRPIYNRLSNGEINEYIVPDKNNMVSFFNDSIFINIRSLFIVLTNYYNTPLLVSVLCLSGIFHTMSVYYCVLNIFQLMTNIETEKNGNVFFFQHNIITAIPIMVDVFFIFMNSTTEIAIPFLLVNIVMGLLFVVEPFYNLTHVAFHLLLVVQNYYMCLSSIQ